MNDLKVFKNENFGEVRTINKNGNIWFVGKDIAKALGYTETNALTKRIDNEDFMSAKLEGMNMNSVLINESGLYSAILGSRLQKAKEFKRWVTSEVLPLIRKTGGYVSNEDLFVDTYLKFADDQTKLMFKATLETVKAQNKKIQQMQPKSEYFDALVERNLLTNFRDTAKELKIKERVFIKWLGDKKYLYRDSTKKLKPYSQYVPDLFELKEWASKKKSGNQTLVTPKGRETFRLLIEKEGLMEGCINGRV